MTPKMFVVYSLINTVRHLQYLCRTRMRSACPISVDYDVVLALCSHHTQEDEGLEDKDAQQGAEGTSVVRRCRLTQR